MTLSARRKAEGQGDSNASTRTPAEACFFFFSVLTIFVVLSQWSHTWIKMNLVDAALP